MFLNLKNTFLLEPFDRNLTLIITVFFQMMAKTPNLSTPKNQYPRSDYNTNLASPSIPESNCVKRFNCSIILSKSVLV